MSENGVNNVEDTDMADCDGEKVVTMMDVLQEQQDFEDDANAVLGASDEKNCTYSKGYVKRQAIYACLTCCSEAKDDPSKRAGVCLACSLNCHENHDLIELYTKRNFRCDCGNPKFNHPCQYTPNKDDLNLDNKYNQNFAGLYCNCHRPYPDPEAAEEDEMIQCIICEDWLHAAHLDATVPSSEQYSEMICKACMDDNEFLHDYSNLAVNVETDLDITSLNDTDIKITNGDEQSEKLENGVAETAEEPVSVDEVETRNDTTTENLVENNTTKVTEDTIETEKTETSQSPEINSEITLENSTNKETPNTLEEKSEENTPDNSDLDTGSDSKDCPNDDLKVDSTGDTEAKSNEDLKADSTSEATTKSLDEDQAESLDNAMETADENLSKNTEELKSIDCNKSSEEIITAETTSEIKNSAKNDTEITNDSTITSENKQDSDTTSEVKNDTEITNDIPITSENKQDSEAASEVSEDPKPIIADNETAPDNVSNNDGINGNSDSDNINEESNGIESKSELSNETDQEMNGDKLDDIPKDSLEESDKVPNTDTVTEHKDNKRKLSIEEDIDDSSVKKPKLDESKCSRPTGVKRLHKGAVFWPSNFRQKLCSCCECLAMYKDLSVLFLIDPEDTVSAYETLGKERVDHTTQYEKGLEALSSLDRIQQINALTEYNKMRDKLLDYLKSFKDRKEIVKEEDIKAFFAGMKPKREPDGVYFCR